MISIKLYIFASLKDALSEKNKIEIDLEQTEWSSDDELKIHLLNVLKKRWMIKHGQFGTRQPPDIPSSQTFMLAINEKYVNPNESIELMNKDEIALIPPITGG